MILHGSRSCHQARRGALIFKPPEKSLRQALKEHEFVVTAELSIEGAASAAEIVARAEPLAPFVDAIQVTDNPGGKVHMAPLAAAAVLLASGTDPVLQLTARDRNRVALQSDLLGAAALGVTSLVLLRGDKIPASAGWPAKAVFDLSGRQLIATAQGLKDDPELRVPDLLIGAVAPVFDPAKVWRPRGLNRKADAGARFIQTQLCFDIDILARYMARLVATHTLRRLSVIISTAVLPNARVARWVRDHVRGAQVPDAVIARLEQSQDPNREGIAIAVEFLAALRNLPGVSGANLMTPGDPALLRETLSRVELS